MSEQTLRRYITTPDNITVGDKIVTSIDGGHIVGVVKDGGRSGGCETDLYLAYICHVNDIDYDSDTMDDLPFLSEEDVPDFLSV